MERLISLNSFFDEFDHQQSYPSCSQQTLQMEFNFSTALDDPRKIHRNELAESANEI